MPPDHLTPAVPTTTPRSSMLVRAAGCISAAILILVFASFAYWELSGRTPADFHPRFPPLVTIASMCVGTLGAAALLLTRIGVLAAPVPRWLLRLAPWMLAAFYALLALSHFLAMADRPSGNWQTDLQGPLLLLLAGLCIVVASEDPAI